jgi:rSAM/selenodomain-associated transferase 1
MVKTRLARSLPPAAVTDLYRCFLFDTVALARSIDDVDVTIMCPTTDVEELSRAVGHSVPVVPQQGNGLAAGLTSVFARFASAGDRRVIAFNSDSPHLPASVLKCAFEALTTCDLVVGPSDDGGYYLVGATAFHSTLFMGDSLGTATALETLLAQGRLLGLSLHLTDTFYDIDVPADLSRVAAELQLDSARAPRTAKWLSEWSRTAAGPDQRATGP